MEIEVRRGNDHWLTFGNGRKIKTFYTQETLLEALEFAKRMKGNEMYAHQIEPVIGMNKGESVFIKI